MYPRRPVVTPAVTLPQAGPEAAEAVVPPADVHAGWVELVERIRLEKTDGMEELYQLFSRGIRFYLCRQLGPRSWTTKSTTPSWWSCRRSAAEN